MDDGVFSAWVNCESIDLSEEDDVDLACQGSLIFSLRSDVGIDEVGEGERRSEGAEKVERRSAEALWRSFSIQTW